LRLLANFHLQSRAVHFMSHVLPKHRNSLNNYLKFPRKYENICLHFCVVVIYCRTCAIAFADYIVRLC